MSQFNDFSKDETTKFTAKNDNNYEYEQKPTNTLDNVVLQPVNWPLGIIGALAGIILGIVLWVIIYQAGYIAGICGFATVFFSIKGFQILGKRLTKSAFWLCIVLSFFSLLLAEGICIVLKVHKLYTAYGVNLSFSELISESIALLQYEEIASGIRSDLLFGYILMLVASFSSIKNIFKNIPSEQ